MDEIYRQILSIISLVFSLIILIGSIALEKNCLKKNRNYFSCYFDFIFIGFFSTVYYVLVVFFPNFKGHDWSIIRSSVVYTEMVWWITKKLTLAFKNKFNISRRR